MARWRLESYRLKPRHARAEAAIPSSLSVTKQMLDAGRYPLLSVLYSVVLTPPEPEGWCRLSCALGVSAKQF